MFHLSRFIYWKFSPSNRNHFKNEMKHLTVWKWLSRCVGHKLDRSPILTRSLVCLKRCSQTFKQDSGRIFEVWTQQCECVVAHRVRRGIQIFALYSNMWDHLALKEFVKSFKYQLAHHGKKLLLSSSIIAAFNWEENKMADNILLE